MKKIFLLAVLLVAGIIIISSFGEKSEMPAQFKTDNENFKQSVMLLNEARDLSNPPESENQPSFELPKEVEEKIFSNNEEGIRFGKLVSDEYLDYMHPELKNMFKNKLIRGTEIYYEGLMMNNAGNITEGAQKQIQGNQLIIEWINWFDKNGKEITDKVFGD